MRTFALNVGKGQSMSMIWKGQIHIRDDSWINKVLLYMKQN